MAKGYLEITFDARKEGKLAVTARAKNSHRQPLFPG
jgi:hypothetical protein